MRSKRELESAYRSVLLLTENVLFHRDPMNIGYMRDEYAPEAARILSGARKATNVDELRDVLVTVSDEQFWAGALSRDKATDIARDLITVVRRLNGAPSTTKEPNH